MNNQKFKKFFGWILIISGAAIIFWCLYSSYNIFNNKAPAPEIFKAEVGKTSSQKGDQGLDAQVEEKLKEMLGEQLKAIVPVNSIPKLLNLISWSIFAGIFIFGGSQLANLGIRLIKEDI